MKIKMALLLWVLVFGFSSQAHACTSFALYGSQIFYGMNFDYFAIPMKFLIESGPGMNIFHLSFLFEQTIDDPEYKGYFAKTCGMNSKGLFCASQEIEPHVEGRKKPARDEVHIDDQYGAISEYASVEQVRENIPGRQWIQFIGPSIHNFFADINGNAMVTETDNKNNFITEIENDFMVMSNFANHDLAGKSYKEAAGADRYITAHDYILKNREEFNLDSGFALLQKVSMKDPDCATLCSMVFAPQKNHIYIALHQNFEKIWKVSLETGTIEPFRGHDRYVQTKVGKDGILAAELAGA